jgi:hypothetical protein
MKLMRVGPPGQERPVVLLPDGTAVDASPVAADYDVLASLLPDARLQRFDGQVTCSTGSSPSGSCIS